MTAVARPRTGAAPQPATEAVSPGASWGTVRTVLRLHRTALVVWTLVVVGLSGCLVWLGTVTADDERAAQEACDRVGQDFCDTTTLYFMSGMDLIGLCLGYSLLVVAAFAGGSLIGREMENGTAHLAWTQGISPVRWLTAKLAVPALVLTASTTALVLLFRWAWDGNRDLLYHDWMGQAFTARGPAAVAYVLCALAIGALAGLLLRRALPALAAATGTTWALSFGISLYRARLWPTVTSTSTTNGHPHIPDAAWQVENGALIHGRRVANFASWRCDGSAAEMRRCVDEQGLTGYYASYHPESHYWPIQLLETGIVLAVTVLATVAVYRLVRRRTA
ncbi:ABC transporter permease [Streptomyces sp. DSM 15324]|uniref:ABC transporter permease n=1 Tax=Streptomyces sp. DSM 15324 TaxID=1739111 RepID=UPI00074A5C34|nr:ABC transporter permease [Streptomyces sp. DSM 15324]KUO10569.1 hypothetical protein AQJ58_19450 [Streptomyces sp. DSM 15324]